MIGWLYRLIYRREIRERQERMSAFAEVMAERRVVNDAKWEQAKARTKALTDSMSAEQSLEEAEAVLARWRAEW